MRFFAWNEILLDSNNIPILQLLEIHFTFNCISFSFCFELNVYALCEKKKNLTFSFARRCLNWKKMFSASAHSSFLFGGGVSRVLHALKFTQRRSLISRDLFDLLNVCYH